MDSNPSNINEKLSAVMDGEATQQEVNEVIQALLADPSLQKQWQKNHVLAKVAQKWDRTQPAKSVQVKSWKALASHYASLEGTAFNVPEVEQDARPTPVKLQWQFPRVSLAMAASFLLIGFFSIAIYFNIPESTDTGLIAAAPDEVSTTGTQVAIQDSLSGEQLNRESDHVLGLIRAHEDRKRAALGNRLQPYSVLVNTRQLSNAPFVRRVSSK